LLCVVAWQPLYIISLIIKSPLLIKKKKEKKKGQENHSGPKFFKDQESNQVKKLGLAIRVAISTHLVGMSTHLDNLVKNM